MPTLQDIAAESRANVTAENIARLRREQREAYMKELMVPVVNAVMDEVLLGLSPLKVTDTGFSYVPSHTTQIRCIAVNLPELVRFGVAYNAQDSMLMLFASNRRIEMSQQNGYNTIKREVRWPLFNCDYFEAFLRGAWDYFSMQAPTFGKDTAEHNVNIWYAFIMDLKHNESLL
jgi:hypothetical protein